MPLTKWNAANSAVYSEYLQLAKSALEATPSACWITLDDLSMLWLWADEIWGYENYEFKHQIYPLLWTSQNFIYRTAWLGFAIVLNQWDTEQATNELPRLIERSLVEAIVGLRSNYNDVYGPFIGLAYLGHPRLLRPGRRVGIPKTHIGLLQETFEDPRAWNPLTDLMEESGDPYLPFVRAAMRTTPLSMQWWRQELWKEDRDASTT